LDVPAETESLNNEIAMLEVTKKEGTCSRGGPPVKVAAQPYEQTTPTL
jgi:hypothetical protein